jgi:hypothetical protein
LDAKARVNIGSFDRGGKNRVPTKTDDHDFHPKTTVPPYGIFVPELDELFLYFTESKVTSDFIVLRYIYPKLGCSQTTCTQRITGKQVFITKRSQNFSVY